MDNVVGMERNGWDKEDDKMKKRLERNSINQIKYRVAA